MTIPHTNTYTPFCLYDAYTIQRRGGSRGTYKSDQEDEDACGVVFAGTTRLVGPTSQKGERRSQGKAGQKRAEGYVVCTVICMSSLCLFVTLYLYISFLLTC